MEGAGNWSGRAAKSVAPDNAEVMEPVEGKSLVSLQACTLPDYEERLNPAC